VAVDEDLRAGDSPRWLNPGHPFRLTLRGAVVGMVIALIILWIFLIRYLVLESDHQPAPAVVMLPILYFSLAIWAGASAVRDEPIVILLAGGLSFVPLGIFLLFMPGFVSWIGILDLGLIGSGLLLLRGHGVEGDDAGST